MSMVQKLHSRINAGSMHVGVQCSSGAHQHGKLQYKRLNSIDTTTRDTTETVCS